VDLVGGYYDSGDHVKFGFPMAFAVTTLSWSVIEFEKELAAANKLKYALDAIKWGTDYFIKAHKEPNVLWAQVGDGDSDHLCWERAEDMTTPRTAYKITTDQPGSEVAGETAAALAAASRAFKPFDSFYSNILLGDTTTHFYASRSTILLRLVIMMNCYGRSVVYEATNDQYYLNYVSQNAASFGGTGWAVTEFSWDNKYAGVQVLLTKVLLQGGSGAYSDTLKLYQAKASSSLLMPSEEQCHNIKLTPGVNLVFQILLDDDQGVCCTLMTGTTCSTSHLRRTFDGLLEYLSTSNAKLNCPDGKLILQMSSNSQSPRYKISADYILGKNPKSMSYLVGYGPNYPTHVHHRGASIPSIFTLPSTVGCVDGFENWYDNPKADPNVILGALVGGPDANDAFSDDRKNYQHTEPTLASNAPLVGVFAKLDSVPDTGDSSSYAASKASPPKKDAPIEFVHKITNTWKTNGTDYFRHEVTGKNVCGKPITYLKLDIENLSGPIYGLKATKAAHMYEFPEWLKALNSKQAFKFVYIQGGEPAKVAVAAYRN
ncbi:Endoglucanase 13, partial [Ananas comosus]